MKTVLYDNQCFDLQSFGGVSKQFTELVKNVSTYNVQLGVKNTNNVYLNEVLKKKGINQYYDVNNWEYSFYLESMQEYDIFHASYFYPMFLKYIGNKPFIGTIHDMILEADMNYDDIIKTINDPSVLLDTRIQLQGKILFSEKASAIIAVSENTKKDIVEKLHCDPNKIYVCYQGANQDFKNCKENESLKNALPKDYILYVGGRSGQKNFEAFAKECANVHRDYPNIEVVCTGRPFTEEEIQLLNDLKIAQIFHHIFTKTDAQMYTLYHNARCFVFPSWYEGFGIPIIESFMAECPVLLNNTSCFPEVAGDAGIYFLLTKEKNDFYETFQKFMDMSEDEINEYKRKGLERSKLFTFQNFAKQVEHVYDAVLNKKEED